MHIHTGTFVKETEKQFHHLNHVLPALHQKPSHHHVADRRSQQSHQETFEHLMFVVGGCVGEGSKAAPKSDPADEVLAMVAWKSAEPPSYLVKDGTVIF